MHDINKARLIAGLPIDPVLEKRKQQPIIETVQLEDPRVPLLEQQIASVEKLISFLFDNISNDCVEEGRMFRKGQDVEDVKSGQCFKVVKPVGHDDSDDVVYDVVCPKTGEMKKKSFSSLRASLDTKGTKSDKPSMKVKEAIEELNVENNEKRDPTPRDVLPHPQKTKIPAHVKKDLQDAKTFHKKEQERLKKHDEVSSVFNEQIHEVLVRLEELMEDDIKQAQMFLTSLMGPILHKIPSSVCRFIHSGGSLKSFFNK